MFSNRVHLSNRKNTEKIDNQWRMVSCVVQNLFDT